MKVAAVVQARMSSRRLPGKMLRHVHDRPLLQYVLDRVGRSREVDHVIVATSVDETDTALAEYCSRHAVDCVRGSLSDVSSRFRDVVDRHGLDAFVRVCGDSPLLDSTLLDEGVRIFRGVEVDLVTNCFPRSFPAGQSVEVVRASTFRQACGRMTDAPHREHVTAFFYAHPGEYRIHNFTNPAGDQSHIDLSVNTAADMALFTRLVDPSMDVPDMASALARYRAVAV